MTFSDETVMAYVDGELDDATRAAVEAALATDSDLTQRVARHRELRARLQGEFGPVLSEPIPERLLAAATGTSANAHKVNILWLKRNPARHWSWLEWGAVAASLILGGLIATVLQQGSTRGPLSIDNGKLLASGVLAHALSEQLASTQSADAPVRVVVSFLSRDGTYCRTFVSRDKITVAGLACRDRDVWRLEALAATPPSTSAAGEYRTAASSLPPAIEQSVEGLIVGDPLDAKTEAAARGNSWHH